MKKLLLVCYALSLLFIPKVNAQTPNPRTVCGISLLPTEGEYVVTVGEVLSVDKSSFTIRYNGCNIECDGQSNFTPQRGSTVAVYGYVEIDRLLGDEPTIDLTFWETIEEDVDIPLPDFNSVGGALGAQEGETGLIEGFVTVYQNADIGLGRFTDGPDTILINFPSGNMPTTNDSIKVLGVIEVIDTIKILDVVSWYQVGETPPSPPPGISWTINEAMNALEGTFACLFGIVNNWTDMALGEGTFTGLTGTINIDFNDTIAFPELTKPIKVFGTIGVDRAINELLAIGWEAQDPLSLNEEAIGVNWTVYPNPFYKYLNIDGLSGLNKITITDLTGRVVVETRFLNNQLDLSNLSKGVYIISVYNSDQLLGNKRIIKQY